MAANTDQEIAPLIENNDQPQDLEIDIPKEDYEPAPECCIYKVPSHFREANRKAYTPQLISIGPIHHGNTNLARMERQKQRYYNKFCQRTSKKTLEEFKSFIKAHVSGICRCYDIEFAFDLELKGFNFEKMILFDAIFIIELFLRNFEEVNDDFLFSKVWLRAKLETDLLLLENQLPFFILEALYNLAFVASNYPSFFYLTCLYLRLEQDQTFNKKGIKHFLDLTRSILVRTCPSNSDERTDRMYNATKLHEAGVKFKATGDVGDDYVLDDLLNVKFEEGVLQIPCFYVDYETETWFRNLMAFEQCHYPKVPCFCSYIVLLDHLVETDKDVDLLIKKKILINEMGSSAAVTTMINNLHTGVASLSMCYDKLAKDLNEYYDNSWNRRCATLNHVYFNNLWRGTATVTAFIVVVLTLTQTVLAILERAMPTK
ncbi:PREDICTED: UPF0481 protein At3g47200 [Theobroma cacao]|uniref:UPF0481 protein At3g47200 n=1 Tax=Theobroma cacao TaxID=3641 RepID=A0AB32VUK5_THECC|nr:PREDICTED: UPF0481 protein At3g47200 [Theobroma cacao]XP_017970084.1 PREDICTED: UPF0481 protein At3g47200 [Theobroma cacao]